MMLLRALLIGTLAFLAAPASSQQFFVLGTAPGPTCSSTLGTVSASGPRTTITWTAEDVLLCSFPVAGDVLATGGGAGGGTACGGGAGQVLPVLGTTLAMQTPIIVGTGGIGSTGATASTPGTVSWVGQNYATGGAQTGILNGQGPTTASGSGSGGCSSTTVTLAGGTGGFQTNENAGGSTVSIASPFAGGGGGGAGSAGGNATVAGHGGTAGAGIVDPITGLTLGGGGGASCTSNGGVGCTPSAGGSGIGGNGGGGVNGGNGAANTGSGGGAAFSANVGGNGAAGINAFRFIGTGCVACILPSSNPITLASAANLAAFYSVIKLSTWSGSCLQITRASDSTTMDVGFLNNVCDWTAADTFAAGTTKTVSKFYDQSGNGLDLICTGTGNLPPAVTPPTFTGLNTWFKIRPISFQGATTIAFQYCTNAAFSIDVSALTVYEIVSPRVSFDANGYWQFSDAAFSTTYSYLQTNDTSLIANYPTSHAFTTQLHPRATPGTLSASFSSSAGAIVRSNGTEVTSVTNASSQIAAGFKIGSTNLVNGIQDIFTVAVYSAAHTSPTMVAKEAEISAPYNLQTSFTNRVVYGGNSLSTGHEALMGQTPPWQAGFGRSTNGPVPSWEPIVMSESGVTLATECAAISGFTALFDGTKTINATQIADPTNDIGITTYTSGADATSSVTTLYNNVTLPCIATLKAAGFNPVVAQTSIARDTWNTTGGAGPTADWKETARTTYNNLLRSGAVANGYVVSDRANIALPSGFQPFGSSARTTDLTWYCCGGGTHLQNLGYLLMGLTDRAAICSTMPVCQ